MRLSIIALCAASGWAQLEGPTVEETQVPGAVGTFGEAGQRTMRVQAPVPYRVFAQAIREMQRTDFALSDEQMTSLRAIQAELRRQAGDAARGRDGRTMAGRGGDRAALPADPKPDARTSDAKPSDEGTPDSRPERQRRDRAERDADAKRLAQPHSERSDSTTTGPRGVESGTRSNATASINTGAMDAGRPAPEEARRMRQRAAEVQRDMQRQVYAILTERQRAFMDEKIQAYRETQDKQSDERYMARMEGRFSQEFEAQREALEIPNSVRRRLLAMSPEERARFWSRIEASFERDR